MLVLLVSLLGPLCQNGHNIPAMSVHGRKNTYLPPQTVTSGMANTSTGTKAHQCVGDRRIKQKLRCGVLQAFCGLHLAQALQ